MLKKDKYPTYIVRASDKAVWKKWKDTNLYLYDLCKPIDHRYPAEWHTFEILTDKFGFFSIDNEQYNMYARLHEQYCERIEAEHQNQKGCGSEIND